MSPRRTLHVILTVWCALTSGARVAAVQNQPAPATGALMGHVVNARGEPVGGAIVTLSGGLKQVALTNVASELPGGPRRALTNADGRFIFLDLAKGSYSLEAVKAGYLGGAYGRRRYGGVAQSIDLAEGERIVALRIPIWEYAAITGNVVDEAGEPLVGVQVTAMRRVFEAGRSRLNTSSPASFGNAAMTDDQGAYRLDALAPGTYAVCVVSSQVTMPSTLIDTYLQALANGSTNDVTRPLNWAGIGLALSPNQPGTLVGDVVTQATGFRGLVPRPPTSNGRVHVYPTTCFPGASPADAQRLDLESGAERTGANFQLTPVSTASISGTIVGPDGPVANVPVRLVPPSSSGLTVELGFDTALGVSDRQGRFSLLGVPVGQYTLRALRMPSAPAPVSGSGAAAPSTDPTLWAAVPVSVDDQGVSNLTVTLQRGFRVSGQMAFDGTLPKPSPELMARFSVQLDPAEGQGSRMPAGYRAAVDAAGRITSNEIPPGKYVFVFLAFANDRQAMPGWETIGGTIDGRDVSNFPFELRGDVTNLVMTLTDHPSEITGTARDAQGRADANAAVLMFPANRANWVDFGTSPRLIRQVRASEVGEFRIRGVPPGEYFVAAVPDEDALDWENPDVLAVVSRTATRVTIALGEKKTAALTTTPIPRPGR
jgi:hypothetical protein